MTAAPDLNRDKQQVVRIAEYCDRLSGDVWELEADASGLHIVARRSSGDDARICTIYDDATADERNILAGALDLVRLLLRVRSRAIAVLDDLRRRLGRQDAGRNAKDLTRQASILLGERQFQQFLNGLGVGGGVHDKATADTRLKGLLAIRSKTEINTDERARQAFLRLRDDFYAWKRGV